MDPCVRRRSWSGRARSAREPYTIVGVMPAGFRSNAAVDVWTPLRPSTQGEGGGENYTIIARRRPGATWGDANGQVASIGAELGKSVRIPAGMRVRMQLVPLQQERTARLRNRSWILGRRWRGPVDRLRQHCGPAPGARRRSRPGDRDAHGPWRRTSGRRALTSLRKASCSPLRRTVRIAVGQVTRRRRHNSRCSLDRRSPWTPGFF